MLNNDPRWNPGARDEDAMTQDERWLVRYEKVMAFLEDNHRNPSKHRIEEHDCLNWLKANRKPPIQRKVG